MTTQNGSGKAKGGRLLERFLKEKPEFKPFKFEMAVDLHERMERLKKETGMSKEAINEVMNYAVRTTLTRLEREARAAGKAK